MELFYYRSVSVIFSRTVSGRDVFSENHVNQIGRTFCDENVLEKSSIFSCVVFSISDTGVTQPDRGSKRDRVLDKTGSIQPFLGENFRVN